MRQQEWTSVALAVVLGAGATVPAFAEGPSSTINAKDVKWGPAPPSLPKGAKVAVMMGDPGKEGPFVARLSMPAGYRVPMHWHSQDEQLTVLSGTLNLTMVGDAAGHGTAVGSGGFHYLPAKSQHAASTKTPTIVQINGNGPFDIQYVNPADDPQKAP